MKTAALVIAAATLALGHVASAGTYIGLAVGPSLDISGDTAFKSTDRDGKLLFGLSFGPLAIEAGALRGSLAQTDGGRGYDVTQLSISAKYDFPLAEGFEAFGRAGLQRTSLSSQSSADMGAADADGTGLLLGAGIEYRINLIATQASLFVEYDFASTKLNGPEFSNVSLQTRGFLLGATVGF